jgi:hypothetical protein
VGIDAWLDHTWRLLERSRATEGATG